MTYSIVFAETNGSNITIFGLIVLTKRPIARAHVAIGLKIVTVVDGRLHIVVQCFLVLFFHLLTLGFVKASDSLFWSNPSGAFQGFPLDSSGLRSGDDNFLHLKNNNN